jgi:hypothetical protein
MIPVDVFFTVMVAPGVTELLELTTVPAMVPVDT